MSVRMQREVIESAGRVRAAAQQTVVEAEVPLPGGLRDEVRLFYTEAQAAPLGAEAVGNRLTVSGRVTFRALYAQGDLTHVHSVEEMRDFTRPLTLPRADASAQYTPVCEVTAVSARVFNGRLLMRAELNVSAEGLETREVSAVTAVEEGDAQVLRQSLTIQRVVGGGEAQGLARGEFEIAPALQATEALIGSGEARVEDILGGADGRATVTGTVDVTVCLASDMAGRPLVSTQYSLPFEQQVTLSGEAGDMLSATARVTDVAAALEAGEGAPTLRTEVSLHVQVQSLKEEERGIVSDVFGVGAAALTPTGERMSFCVGSVNEQTAESGRLQLMLPEDAPRIKTVLAAFVQPVLAGAAAQGGKLQADMLLRATLVYMTEDSGIPVAYTAEEPVRMAFAGAMDENDVLSLQASRVEATAVAGDRAEVRYVMSLHANGVRCSPRFVVTDVVREEGADTQPVLALYRVQGDERLWDIMKRYRLPLTGLQELNDSLRDLDAAASLPAGMEIVAYRR